MRWMAAPDCNPDKYAPELGAGMPGKHTIPSCLSALQHNVLYDAWAIVHLPGAQGKDQGLVPAARHSVLSNELGPGLETDPEADY